MSIFISCSPSRPAPGRVVAHVGLGLYPGACGACRDGRRRPQHPRSRLQRQRENSNGTKECRTHSSPALPGSDRPPDDLMEIPVNQTWQQTEWFTVGRLFPEFNSAHVRSLTSTSKVNSNH